MSVADTYDLARALKEQFGLRGTFVADVGATILPVIQVADLRGEAAPLGIPWQVWTTSAAAVGQRSYVSVRAMSGYSLRVDLVRVLVGAPVNLGVGFGAASLAGGDSQVTTLDSRRWIRPSTGVGGPAPLLVLRLGQETLANIGSRGLDHWRLEANGAVWGGTVWLGSDPQGEPQPHQIVYGGADNTAITVAIGGYAFVTR